jgi:PAS domain S-box-containing protein
VNQEGSLLYANRAFGTMVGRDSESLAGTKFAELLSRGSAIFYETHFSPSLLLRGALDEISLDLRRSDGTHHPIFVNAARRPGSDGTLSELHLTVFNAKQRKQYETELLRARREHEEVAEIVRRSADGIMRFDSDGRIETWNNGAQQIFGYSQEMALGRSLSSLFPAQSESGIARSLEQLRSGLEVNLDDLALHQSGKLVDVSVNLSPHMEAPGTLVGFSAIFRDTTDRKKAENAVLQSEKLASVGRLAGSIAHEINNPLEAVTNLLYILATRVTDEETRQFVVTAQEELARVSQIAVHTLRFHKQSSNRTEVNLQVLAESILALYRARLDNSQVVAIADCIGSPPLVCYEGELRQILVNLVGNAYDAMRHGGKLTLRAHPTQDWKTRTSGVRILVADSGTGMDADTLQHIFEPFFSTKGIGGTGLGLWITKDLVAKNGGSIAVRSSVRVGRSGSVFSLFFPLAKA